MEAIGYQFGFQYRYPKLSNPVADMHIPVGTPVTVHVTSRDVIHGFLDPRSPRKARYGFRVKLTPCVSRRRKSERIRLFAPRIAASRMAVCTPSFTSIRSKIFAKWFSSQQGGGGSASGGGGSAQGAAVALNAGDVAAGQQLFGQKCSACHSLGPYSQKLVGPGLGKLFSDPDHPKLVNGTDVSPQDIALILQNGYQGDLGVMPSSQVNQINNKDIANLVAYLVSLSKK